VLALAVGHLWTQAPRWPNIIVTDIGSGLDLLATASRAGALPKPGGR